MTATYSWTTQKGAKIALTVTSEHITQKTIWADGHEIPVSCDNWVYSINALTINGEAKNGEFSFYSGGKRVINYGYATIKGTRHPLLVLIPNDVESAIWGEEKAARAAHDEKTKRADDKYEAHLKMMRNAMQE